ncbi:nascent polypeptide-associated complex subunit beta [Penicillium atrosanguineum]|nr:nascent polypeptide-associated complex subunit beta [Penicillium atrosanguineum]
MLSKLGRMIVPDTETFRSNTQGTYNIIEASCKLGIPNIVIASNTAVYSISFAQGDADYTSFPIEEDQHDRITVTMDQAKLAKMQASVRIGKGTPRRKVKKVTRNSGADDKKLQATLKKMNVQPIQGIEEVNMFKEDGNVIHFAAPRVHASVPSNTFALYGNGEEKELTELVPGILNQLGPDSLASLRKLAESYQNMQKAQGGDKKDDDEDDIPDLVEGENFESKVE